MKKWLLGVSAVIFLAVNFAAYAADKEAAKKEDSDSTHLVPSKFKLGAAERIRYEYFENANDLRSSVKDNKSYFRFKTSLSGEYDFTDDIDAYVRLTNENRAYLYWAGASASAHKSASKKGYHYDINETVFDNLYFDLNNLAGLPLKFRIGRQDLDGYGENFLIKDGTPLDGTRTYYFQAAKGSWSFNDKNSFDVLAIRDLKADDWMPVINAVDDRQQLNSSNEYAFAGFFKTDAIKNLHMEDYYIFKHENANPTARMTKYDSDIHTVGVFLKYQPADSWTLRGQAAGQFGDYGSKDREAVGAYFFVDKDFKDVTMKPQASLGYVHLSGNKNGGSKNTAWDPLFNRDTWYSVLFAQYLSSETETSYWTNLRMLRTSLSAKPTEKLKATLTYNYLWADQLVPPTKTLFSGAHKDRGHLPQARLDYQINKSINTYVLAEYFIPGDFYVKSADPAVFLRWELSYKY